jgi:hypothetical protein
LIWQWQDELEDKLGIPAAVWSTQKKCWLDGERRALTQRGDPALVTKCPWRIGIVSTGLIVMGSDEGERGALVKKVFGVVILDEAHKARASRGLQGRDPPKLNNLLMFLRSAARNAQNVILGTATPIQLDAVELWDLLSALNQAAPQVLGTHTDGGEWTREESIQFLTGQRPWPQNDTNCWGLFRNPLPPDSEDAVFRDIRDDARLESKEVLGPRFDELRSDVRRDFLEDFETLAERHNPIVRRVVRRTRPMLEQSGLLKRIGVITHPRGGDGLASVLFDGEGLVMSLAFNAAYEAAEAFSRLYAARQPGAGFLKTILLRRIGSSARAGLETARRLLGRIDAELPEEEVGDEGLPTADAPPDPQEIVLLREVERNLAAVVGGTDTDPKVQVILHYLGERDWLERNGAIIFSQYRTTAEWVLEALCETYPNEPVALYAGGTASFVQRGNDRRSAKREHIKEAIQQGDVRLVCATDAACEGLNLQRLPNQRRSTLESIAARTAQGASTKDRPSS